MHIHIKKNMQNLFMSEKKGGQHVQNYKSNCKKQ